jgi:hypothetical protein
MDAMDDLPLELLGEDEEEAESHLLQLLQRLRFTGGAEGFGFDLCDLALGGGLGAPPELVDASPKGVPALEDVSHDRLAAQPQADRTAARLRARFVKSLVLDSLRASAREADDDDARGAPGASAAP